MDHWSGSSFGDRSQYGGRGTNRSLKSVLGHDALPSQHQGIMSNKEE
jgi:hypothetical protein